MKIKKATSQDQNTDNQSGHGDGGAGDAPLDLVFPLNPSKAERAALRRERKASAPSAVGHSALTLGQAETTAAAVVNTLSKMASGAWGRRWEACGGRPLTESDKGETLSLFHAEFAKAAALSGVVPFVADAWDAFTAGDGEQGRRLWEPLKARRANALTFRALLSWSRAVKVGNQRSRAQMWGKGAELLIDSGSLVSIDSLLSLKRTLEDGEGRTLGESISVESTATVARPFSGAARAALRLRVWWYRQCLVVYWSDKGGERWERGLADDLRRLAHCARVARHGGLVAGLFADKLSEGGECGDAMRQAAKRLRDRIASGDALTTSKPAMADSFLRLYRRGVAWEVRPIVSSVAEDENKVTAASGAWWARWVWAPVGVVARHNGVALVGSVECVTEAERQAARVGASAYRVAGLGYCKRVTTFGAVAWVGQVDHDAARQRAAVFASGYAARLVARRARAVRVVQAVARGAARMAAERAAAVAARRGEARAMDQVRRELGRADYCGGLRDRKAARRMRAAALARAFVVAESIGASGGQSSPFERMAARAARERAAKAERLARVRACGERWAALRWARYVVSIARRRGAVVTPATAAAHAARLVRQARRGADVAETAPAWQAARRSAYGALRRGLAMGAARAWALAARRASERVGEAREARRLALGVARAFVRVVR